MGSSVTMAAPAHLRILWVLLAGLSLTALAMHVPGHLSMDSSLQIYEAEVGRSVSFAPPFMSALLRWLGGGTQGTSLFVLLCTVMTFGGMALALDGVRAQDSSHRLRARTGLVLLIVAVSNPVIFLYVGIIWKDVLFAALLAFATGLMLHAASQAGIWARWQFFLAGLVLLLTPLVRQHGVLLAPLLLAACIVGAGGGWSAHDRRRRLLRCLIIALVYAGLFGAISAAVQRTIVDSGTKSMSVGITAVQSYDVAGMIAAGVDTRAPAALTTAAFRTAVSRTYSDDRIDFVLNDPVVAAGFKSVDAASLRKLWLEMIAARPDAYLRMKARQYSWLLGLHRLDRCLPIHLGVEGNSEFLAASGIARGSDDRDRALFWVSVQARHLLLYRHWFYLVIFAACVVAFARTWRSHRSQARVVILALIAAIGLLYASFGPTNIACDFRYLYPGLVLISVLFVYLVAWHSHGPAETGHISEGKG